MKPLADLLPTAMEAVDRASARIRQSAPGVLTAKGDRDYATEVDFAVERDVRSFFREAMIGSAAIGLVWLA